LQFKRRGFGVGKWNGPGGKVEPGETLEQAVVREVKEETGLVVSRPEKMAELIEAAFDGAPADSMKDVRILFIGSAEQGERVRAAVEPTGAVFVLHELK